MAVGEGQFRLHTHFDALDAGDYRLSATQTLTTAKQSSSTALPVQRHDTHLRVRSPRYLLPPDQVLSVFPPASSEGSYGGRLPQVVIKRRTLPWERNLAGTDDTVPWLALVIVAEGEGVLRTNQKVEDCVTPGTTLPGRADTELGAYLEVTRSVVDDVFPTRKDVPLLAHAREVDIDDTELMLGDDDGYVAVVIANRLPVSGRDEAGSEVPVTYLACLVNLEEQLDVLREEAPTGIDVSLLPTLTEHRVLGPAQVDHAVMDTRVSSVRPTQAVMPQATSSGAPLVRYTASPASPASVHEVRRGWATSATPTVAATGPDVVGGFAVHDIVGKALRAEPSYRFPVLLHWTFTSAGDASFKTLMQGLDSGLLGTVPPPATPTATPSPPPRQPPLEVVETGHVGLPHRTRTGDTVRAWYRGPLLAHPTTEERLPLAHASDQLRVVVPDGREDLSLASAFEIGRLLALSRPSMVAALLRWRRTSFAVARARTILESNRALLEALLGTSQIDPTRLDLTLGRHLASVIAAQPSAVLGPPRLLHDAGRGVDLPRDAVDVLADGFGLDAAVLAQGGVSAVVHLRDTTVPTVPVAEVLRDARTIREPLDVALGNGLADLVSNTLAPILADIPGAGPTIPRSQPRGRRIPDRVDALMDDTGHEEDDS